ncbi:MAG: sulfatase [Acidobacteriota bacterium]
MRFTPQKLHALRPFPLVLALLLAGCSPTHRPAPTAPNLVLISIDTLRPDRLGCYGGRQVETPTIDAFAASGVRFANAFTPVPLTLPAHWTIHTGIDPWHHGIVDNGMTPTGSPGLTLGERFAAAGYDTAAFVSAFVLHRTFGLDRGFTLYDDGPSADAALDQLLHATGRADERVDRALAWLRKPRTRPFFLWLHLYDPHAPYDPPADFRARYAGRPYDGEIAFVDTQVARLSAALERSGAASHTIVALLSDHGESLGEHGEQSHGILLYDATLRVPMIFRLPGRLPKGEVRSDEASLADVAPTVLALAGLEPLAGIDGRDLFGGEKSARRLAAISEAPLRRFGWSPLFAIRGAGWKYIAAPRPELYDLTADPSERRDQSGQRSALATDLARGARGIEKELNARLAVPPASEPDAETRANLAALGYMGSGRKPAGSTLPDPKDVIGSIADFDRAYQLFGDGHLDQAEALFRSLAANSPLGPGFALPALGRIAQMRGRNQEAEALFQSELDHDPEAVSALAQLARLALLRNDPQTAILRSRRLVELIPRDSAASRLLAEALLAAGDAKGAEAEWRRGLSVAPRAGWLRLGYARFLIAERRADEARRELKVIAEDPDLPADLVAAAEAEAERLRSPRN